MDAVISIDQKQAY